MRQAEDIEYTEFFDVGRKVTLHGGFGVVVRTYDLDARGIVRGGGLIIRWDTNVEADYEKCAGDDESLLACVCQSYEFSYINDDGTTKK